MSDISDATRTAGTPFDGELVRARQVRRFEELLPRYRAQVDWPAPRLDQERSQALRRLLEVAVGRSSWHRARLGGVDVARMTAADLAGLPVMTKTDLMDNFDEIVTDPRLTRARCEEHLTGGSGEDQLPGEYHVIASSGSSGSRGVYVYGWDAWAICYASTVRVHDDDEERTYRAALVVIVSPWSSSCR